MIQRSKRTEKLNSHNEGNQIQDSNNFEIRFLLLWDLKALDIKARSWLCQCPASLRNCEAYVFITLFWGLWFASQWPPPPSCKKTITNWTLCLWNIYHNVANHIIVHRPDPDNTALKFNKISVKNWPELFWLSLIVLGDPFWEWVQGITGDLIMLV